MIPRSLHYIWVGERDLPTRNREWMKDNAALCSGYNIRLWREADLGPMPPFAARAYAAKKWAFVSDYFRFKILYEHGGIYLDTDTELLRSPDALLAAPGFSGWNRAKDHIYCGIIGATPHHPFLAEILQAYDDLPDGAYPTSPQMFTQTYQKTSHQDFVIYPSSVFYPVSDGEVATPEKIKDAYATHHWDESWRSFVPARKILRRLGIVSLYHALKGNK